MHHISLKGVYSQLFWHALYTFEVLNIFYKLSKGLEIFSKLCSQETLLAAIV